MSKPRVIINCIADQYASGNERIIEFSDYQAAGSEDGGVPGGLISFRRRSNDNKLSVQLYRLEAVEVAIGRERWAATLAQLADEISSFEKTDDEEWRAALHAVYAAKVMVEGL